MKPLFLSLLKAGKIIMTCKQEHVKSILKDLITGLQAKPQEHDSLKSYLRRK